MTIRERQSGKTYISSLIDVGINIDTVRAYAGHADERTTYLSYCFDRRPEAEKTPSGDSFAIISLVTNTG